MGFAREEAERAMAELDWSASVEELVEMLLQTDHESKAMEDTPMIASSPSVRVGTGTGGSAMEITPLN